MPKRKNKSKDNKKDSKRSKNSEEDLAEVSIKAKEESSTSSSDSSYTDYTSSSSDDSRERKKKGSKKKKHLHCCCSSGKSNISKRHIKRLQIQIDTFQRNVLAKFQHLETLFQKSSSIGNCPTNSSRPFRPPPIRRPPPPDAGLPQLSTEEVSDDFSDLPVFPISDEDFVYEFDEKLSKDAHYRLRCARQLNTRQDYSFPNEYMKMNKRPKVLMFHMFTIELLATFSWSGMNSVIRGFQRKGTFRKFIGIVALVRATLDYGITNEDEKIQDSDLMYGMRDALKRAPDKLKQLGFKTGAFYHADVDRDSETKDVFKKEQLDENDDEYGDEEFNE